MPCEKMTTKKYTSRGSPPYPANECRGLTKKGNDGAMWESRGASNGVYRWMKASGSESASKTSASAKSSKTKFLELQHKAFKLAVKVGMMRGVSTDPLSMLFEEDKKKLKDHIRHYEKYIHENENEYKIPTEKELKKEMEEWMMNDEGPGTKAKEAKDSKKYTLLTKAEIVKTLTKTKFTFPEYNNNSDMPRRKDIDFLDIDFLRTLYGPYLILVNPKNIKRCNLKPGQSFYGIETGPDIYVDGANRIKAVKKIRFQGYTDEYDDLNGDLSLKYRSKYSMDDTSIVLDGFGARSCDFRNTTGYSKNGNFGFDSGRGCDVVYMFEAST
jgi:hypothetical protein